MDLSANAVRIEPEAVRHPNRDALRAEYARVIDALRELANALDDHGLPSMTVDHIRHEIIALKIRNTNNQPGENDNGTVEMADRIAG